jgi:hypothetical protein
MKRLKDLLDQDAYHHLSDQCDIAELEASWKLGNYGTLYDYETAEPIGPATREQALWSYAAWPTGTIEVVISGKKRTVYVAH